MKRLFLSLAAALTFCGAASAQRLQAGFRGGINTTDFRFTPVTIGGTQFVAGPSRTGYEAGFILRLNLSKYVHLQSELNYNFINYAVRGSRENMRTDVRLRSERLEIPLQLGFQFGIVRLFGGASFRVNHSLKSSHPDLLRIGFGSDKVAWMGGFGVQIKHFFLDVRIQGYPGPTHRNTFLSKGSRQSVRMRNDIVWGGSLGFFF